MMIYILYFMSFTLQRRHCKRRPPCYRAAAICHDEMPINNRLFLLALSE
jgi:hypothetical protein